MGRLILEHNSFDNLVRLDNINKSLNEFIDALGLSLVNKDFHSRLKILDSHPYAFGNFFNDLVYSPWEDVNQNIHIPGINQVTHQSISNLFFAYPNGGKSYDTFEEFEADGNDFFGYIGLEDYVSIRNPFIKCCLDWLKWRANFYATNQPSIDWSEIKNGYFPNLFYSNFVLASKLEELKVSDKKVTSVAKNYCDDFNQMGLGQGELMALAQDLGKEIAEANYYVYESNLSQSEGKIKKSLRKIYSLTLENGRKQYLSIDFHKCFCFEICDYKGRHLGEYRFDSIQNGSADESGAHDIVSLK